MLFSKAFAAETDETSNLKVSFTDEGMINTVDEDVTPGISVRAPAPAAVSYTHLDVYKRQGYGIYLYGVELLLCYSFVIGSLSLIHIFKK